MCNADPFRTYGVDPSLTAERSVNVIHFLCLHFWRNTLQVDEYLCTEETVKDECICLSVV